MEVLRVLGIIKTNLKIQSNESDKSIVNRDIPENIPRFTPAE